MVFIEKKISGKKKKVCNGHVTVARGMGGEGSSQRSYDRWGGGGGGEEEEEREGGME